MLHSSWLLGSLIAALMHPAPQTLGGVFTFPSDQPGVVVLKGQILDGASGFFERLVAVRPAITTVALNSPGGSGTEALLIAKVIRERGLDTVVPPTAKCASACSMIFVAGKNRRVMGALGVHQGTLPVLVAATAAELQTNLADEYGLLAAAGISPDFLWVQLQTPAASMHWLSASELKQFRVEAGTVRGLDALYPEPKRHDAKPGSAGH